jgi:hypothetical protein
MTLEQIIRDLANSNLGGENEWYRWKEISDTNLPKDVFLPAGNQYAKNVALKLELHKVWSDTNSDIAEHVALAKYYVSTWGGIRSNKDETLRKYVTQEPDSIIRNGKKGIASWSKVLCIRDPNRYAIFDARVSTALNCLQIIGHTEHPSLFPLLQGQNNTINAGRLRIKAHADQHHWSKARELEFYSDYLNIVRNVAQSCRVPNTRIYTIEMLLFAQAEVLLLKALPNQLSEK